MKKTLERVKARLKLTENVKSIFISSKEYLLTNILFTAFIITSVLNGVILRAATVGNPLSFRPFLGDLVVVLIVASFAYFLKPKNRFKYFISWGAIFTLICVLNAMYYKQFLSFTSLSFLQTAMELGGYLDAVTEAVFDWSDLVYLWQIFTLIFVHIQLKRKGYYEKVEQIEAPKIRFLNTIVVSLILLGLFISMLTSLHISRLHRQWNREFVVQEFGIYIYQFNDALVTIRARLNSMFGFDEASRKFREHFAEVPEYQQHTNMFTGIFEGKNIIVIHAESMMSFLISDRNNNWEPVKFNGIEVTPNLNRLASEGIFFPNFYGQEGVGTSSDAEFTFNTSLMPSSTGTVFMNFFDREYVTIPWMLRDMGYHTFSMHGNRGSAWNRQVVHPRLGYNHFYYYRNAFEIDEVIGLGLSDKSFFRQSIDIIRRIDEEHSNWYGLLMTLTNHTPFSAINIYSEDTGWYFDVNARIEILNEQTGQMEEHVSPFLEGTILGNYMRMSRYADEAIGQFIEDMEEAGLLENTVIIIYGDHDNRIRRSEYNRFYNYDPVTGTIRGRNDEGFIDVDEYFYEINRAIPLIIWTPNLVGTRYNQRIYTVMGMIDVQPTLGNMFGFYNRFALGVDIMSVEDNIVAFPNGDWKTNRLYYMSARGAFRQIDMNAEITQEYLNRGREHVDRVNAISNGIILHDLIRRVGNNPDEFFGEN